MTMQQDSFSTGPDTAPAIDDRYGMVNRILAVILVIGVLIQAYLGSAGFFKGEDNLIDVHSMIANILFLVAIAQVVCGFLSFRNRAITPTHLGLLVVLLVLVVAQIGLGYSTRDSLADATPWHITNGVLLMGLGTVVAVMFWLPRRAAR